MKPSESPSAKPSVLDNLPFLKTAGKIVDATIKAIIESTDGVKYQVDFGFDQTA